MSSPDVSPELPAHLRLQRYAKTAWQLVGLAALGWVVLQVLQATRQVVVPVVTGLLIAALLEPLSRLLRGVLPRYLAAAASLLTLLSVVTLASWLSGHQLVKGLSELIDSVPSMLDSLEKQLESLGLGLGAGQVQSALESLEEWFRGNGQGVARHALSAGNSALSLMVGALLALVTAYFIAADGRGMWTYLLDRFPRRHREPVDRSFAAGWVSLQKYIRAQLVVAAADAVGIGIGAWALGVPFALPIAVIVFMTAFVPVVGAFVSGALAVLVAFAFVGVQAAGVMLLVVVAVQQLESNVLQPIVMGKAVALHPFAVIIAVSLGGYLLGVTGAVFAIPLLAFVKSVTTELASSKE